MAWVALLVVLFGLSGCADRGIVAPLGTVAMRQQAHLLNILLWMLPVIVPLFVALPIILWRSRLGGAGRYRPHWEFSWLLELFVWGVPLVVVWVLSWALWHETLDLDPYKPVGDAPPLVVQAIALDWKWVFLYPSLGVASADRLVLPTDQPVRFEITSGTVLQAFSIPRIGGQIYAMPGMVTEFNLRTAEAARLKGLNMQYNGEFFARQSFSVDVMSPDDFTAWRTQTLAADPLDASALQDLLRREVLPVPKPYGSITGDPFGLVVQALKSGHPVKAKDG